MRVAMDTDAHSTRCRKSMRQGVGKGRPGWVDGLDILSKEESGDED
ncbi:hypothetical protein ACFL5A_01230 [Gemmatimonadota bacterium]